MKKVLLAFNQSILTTVLLLLLYGCGGGKGDSSPKRLQFAPEPIYNGLETVSAVDTFALGHVLNALFGGTFSNLDPDSESALSTRVVTPNYSFSATPLGEKNTPKDSLNAKTTIAETETCLGGGKVEIEGEISDEGLGSLDLEYTKCSTSDSEISGSAIYTIRAFDTSSLSPTVSVLNINKFSVTILGENFSVSGTIEYIESNDFSRKEIYNIEMARVGSDFQYRLQDYSIIYGRSFFDGMIATEEHDGTIFMSSLGYVDMTTDPLLKFESGTDADAFPSAGGLRLTGRDGTSVYFDFDTISGSLTLGEKVRDFYLIPEEFSTPTQLDLSDQDEDGIHASIELFYGLSITENNSNENYDDDLFTNIEEYTRQSNIIDPSSPVPPSISLSYQIESNSLGSNEYLVQSKTGGTLIAMSVGDERRIRVSMNFRGLEPRDLEVLEKFKVKFFVPKGFRLEELDSSQGDCAAETQSCVFPDDVSLTPIITALVVAEDEAEYGVNEITAEFEGFFDLVEPAKNTGSNLLVGTKIEFGDELSHRVGGGDTEYLSVLNLVPSVYWGYFEKDSGNSVIKGNDASRNSDLYLTRIIDINASHFIMSGFNVIAPYDSAQIMAIEDRSDPGLARTFESVFEITNNKFYRGYLSCDFGNPVISGNEFFGAGLNARLPECESVELYNNIFNDGYVDSDQSLIAYNNIFNDSHVSSEQNTLVYNNAFINTRLSLVPSVRDPIESAVVINNIFFYEMETYVLSLLGPDNMFDVSHNAFSIGTTVYSNSMGEFDATINHSNIELPMSLTTSDLVIEPSENSTLIDAGSIQLFPDTDILMNSRPIDGIGDGIALPDIGPFEFLP